MDIGKIPEQELSPHFVREILPLRKAGNQENSNTSPPAFLHSLEAIVEMWFQT